MKEPLERTERLISGFESRYGMELLATVHWAAQRDEAEDFGSIVEVVQRWNKRKKYTFAEDQLRIAWKRLLDEDWIGQRSIAVQ